MGPLREGHGGHELWTDWALSIVGKNMSPPSRVPWWGLLAALLVLPYMLHPMLIWLGGGLSSDQLNELDNPSEPLKLVRIFWCSSWIQINFLVQRHIRSNIMAKPAMGPISGRTDSTSRSCFNNFGWSPPHTHLFPPPPRAPPLGWGGGVSPIKKKRGIILFILWFHISIPTIRI